MADLQKTSPRRMSLAIGLDIPGYPINAIGGQSLDCLISTDVQPRHLDDSPQEIHLFLNDTNQTVYLI